MDRLLITGGRRLEGAVAVSGAKNSALKLMAAALLADGETVIHGAPRIADCLTMSEVLEHLGARVSWEDSTVVVDAADGDRDRGALRAGARDAGVDRRARSAACATRPCPRGHAGGCNIGSRKIDLHLKGLERMGATFSYEHGYLLAEAPQLHGAFVSLDFPSVGATENVLMAAVGATGTTVVENAAREPEIQDLADDAHRDGREDRGRRHHHDRDPGHERAASAVTHRVVPDRVEAGTFATRRVRHRRRRAADRTRAPITWTCSWPSSPTPAPCCRRRTAACASRWPRGRAPVDFVTLPYPGFPTDLQPQMMAMLATADGTSIATENVFESRFMFVDELHAHGRRHPDRGAPLRDARRPADCRPRRSARSTSGPGRPW